MVRSHEYHDSVRLMQVSEQIRQFENVEEAILMMATDNNKKLLGAAGLMTEEVKTAARDDLVIGIVARTDQAANNAMAKADEFLRKQSSQFNAYEHRSLESAMETLEDANLALISIPGEYATAETQKVLQKGLNVMLFSDNVSIEDELSLKQLAYERGLLLMGPDCGTAIINGYGFGFANAVSRGNVGIIGASGTGIQELSVQLQRHGLGISHAIGTGGRDLKSQIGGLSMLMGIDMLAVDTETEIIILTSKPPDKDVAKRVLDKAAACGKPIVVNFLGDDNEMAADSNLITAKTLTGAAHKVARILGRDQNDDSSLQRFEDDLQKLASEQAQLLSPNQRYLRGLYSGGTLCYEAMLILRNHIGNVYSNIALSPNYCLNDPSHSREHTLLDLGDDMFTRGQAHPMIDPNLRNQRFREEADDDNVAVILLDVVLGYGCHENPAEKLSECIQFSKARAADGDRHLIVITTVCGTEQDPQDLVKQKKLLGDAGAIVVASNAEASRMAGLVLNTITKEDAP